jgi:hypothetical protein
VGLWVGWRFTGEECTYSDRPDRNLLFIDTGHVIDQEITDDLLYKETFSLSYYVTPEIMLYCKKLYNLILKLSIVHK